MSVFPYPEDDSPESVNLDSEERLKKPSSLRQLHNKFCLDDADTSANRAAIDELMNFVPPYDQKELESRGMGGRFNVNSGNAAAIVNEAIGTYLDIWTSPSKLVEIVLDATVDPETRKVNADIMSDEWTKMIRDWDQSTPNILMLSGIFVSQGIAIPWFEDKATMVYTVASLEDCKFDNDAVAITSKIEAMTMQLSMSAPELHAKIEGHDGETWVNGWNVPVVKHLLATAMPKGDDSTWWNYEETARLIKSCRVGAGVALPRINLIYGVMRELDGTISLYATSRDDYSSANEKSPNPPDLDEWAYKKTSAFENASQMFQIFPFSMGSKGRIYTIRGLGYPLYEPGQADNILRCKMMDGAAHRSGEMFQAEGTIDSIEDLQFIDLGFGVVVPKGLRGVPANNMLRFDESIGYVLKENEAILAKHSRGLASNTLIDQPTARRNEMQVTAELEHDNKMQGFAISLFYGPFDSLIRELVRRAFTESQTDLTASILCDRMKEACIQRGVPKELFSRIDLAATRATRLSGAGSKSSRLIGFQQMGALFSSMDDQGQEFFNYDYAAEIKGDDAAMRYFGKPGERRGHVDMALAQLENNDLLEGQMIDPVDGENHMVHLRTHLEALVTGIEEVNQGQVDISDWTMRNIPLYKHCVDTLAVTSVHESRIPELNSYRQQIQQAGEVIDNGLRHINKIRQQEQEQAAAAQAAGQPTAVEGQPTQGGAPAQQAAPAGNGPSPAQADNDLKMAKIFAESHAKIQAMHEMNNAKIEIMKQQSIVKNQLLDAETAADIRRKEVLARATG